MVCSCFRPVRRQYSCTLGGYSSKPVCDFRTVRRILITALALMVSVGPVPLRASFSPNGCETPEMSGCCCGENGSDCGCGGGCCGTGGDAVPAAAENPTDEPAGLVCLCGLDEQLPAVPAPARTMPDLVGSAACLTHPLLQAIDQRPAGLSPAGQSPSLGVAPRAALNVYRL